MTKLDLTRGPVLARARILGSQASTRIDQPRFRSSSGCCCQQKLFYSLCRVLPGGQGQPFLVPRASSAPRFHSGFQLASGNYFILVLQLFFVLFFVLFFPTNHDQMHPLHSSSVPCSNQTKKWHLNLGHKIGVYGFWPICGY